MRSTPEQRFWSKVAITPGCWLWLASTDGRGYGQFWSGVKLIKAHKWAYQQLVGPVPAGMDLDHVKARGCAHRTCVNPAHLEPVTRKENIQRGRNANREKTHCAYGHPLDGLKRRGERIDRVCLTCRREQARRLYHQKQLVN